MDAIIYKVKITDEALCDYEDEFDGMPMPKYDLKAEVEDYILFQKKDGRLCYDYYFRVRYFDETQDEMLMLFLYKGRKTACMQEYDLCGLCRESDWSQELEDDGAIRNWLKSKLETDEKTDWVWDYRIWKAEQEKAQNEDYGEEYIKMVKELLKDYKLNKMKLAVGDSSDTEIAMLADRIEYLEKCVASLDEDAKEIIEDIYFKGMSFKRAGIRYGYSKAGMAKRAVRLISMLEILFKQKYGNKD